MFPLFYFILFYPYFLFFFPSFFFPSFFLLHTHTLTSFFSLFPSFLFFPTTSSTHVPLLFFLYFLLSSFSLPLHTPRMYHTVSAPLSSLKVFASFFFFFDNLKATRKRADGDDDDEDDWNIRKSLIHYNKSELWWQKHFVTICPYFVTNTYGDEMVTKQHSSPKLHHLMYWWWKCFVTKKKI